MNDLLFDVPWWIPTLLAIVAIALFVNGNRRQELKIRNAGVGLLLLAIGWALLSYFVDTDKEKVEKAMRQLPQDVVDEKWDAFKSELMPSVGLSIANGPSTGSADTLTNYARTMAAFVKLKSAVVRHLTLEQDGTYIIVHCDMISTQDSLAPLETSSWQFDWQQTTQGWKIQQIRLLSIRDVPTDMLARAAEAVKPR